MKQPLKSLALWKSEYLGPDPSGSNKKFRIHNTVTPIYGELWHYIDLYACLGSLEFKFMKFLSTVHKSRR
jgi:hypothetical protein